METDTKKIKRNKFFRYSGAALLGIISLPNIPLNFLQKKISKETSLKVTANPNAIGRNSKKA